MIQRKIASLSVSPIGLGSMAFTGQYGLCPAENALTAIHAALDTGVNLVETADYIDGGMSEIALGALLGNAHKTIMIATRFGLVTEKTPFPVSTLTTNDGCHISVCGNPDYVRFCAERTLSRLKRDFIDLWLLNYVDPAVPVEETIGAMALLKQQGKVREIGICNANIKSLVRAHATHPLAAISNEFSLWQRNDMIDIFPFIEKNHIAYIAWAPLGHGFFAGVRQVGNNDVRQQLPRFRTQALNANLHKYSAFALLANDAGVTRAQLALFWALRSSPQMIVIPSTRRDMRVRQNLATNGISVSSETMGILDKIIKNVKPEGETAIGNF